MLLVEPKTVGIKGNKHELQTYWGQSSIPSQESCYQSHITDGETESFAQLTQQCEARLGFERRPVWPFSWCSRLLL